MNVMTCERAVQWMREHQEKGVYEDLTDAIRKALADDDDEDLGRYVIESFERAIEGEISPERAARDMFTALVGCTFSSLVQHMAEIEEWARKENEI